jgi:hypothetical protein
MNEVESRPPEVVDLLGKVAILLQEGHPDKALGVVSRARINSPWATNALGVCQLRLGNARGAVDVFRGLVLAGSLFLRRDVPTVFKINYATALLAADNITGCVRVLAEIEEEGHPAVQQLRAVIRRWKGSLSLWQKVQWFLGDQPARPLVLDFTLGDLG